MNYQFQRKKVLFDKNENLLYSLSNFIWLYVGLNCPYVDTCKTLSLRFQGGGGGGVFHKD